MTEPIHAYERPLRRFAPPRKAKDILRDLAEPGDWAYIAGYWWKARSFNGGAVTLIRPPVGERDTMTMHTHVNAPQHWRSAHNEV